MKNKHVSSLVAFAVAACCGAAHAGFSVEDAAAGKAPQVVVPRIASGLAQVGSPSGPQPTVRGMAKEITLLTALKQIVPQGWRAKRGGGLDTNLMVSWRGEGRSWVEVLQEVAAANNFSAMIDWNKQEVTVAPPLFAPTGDGLRPTSVIAPAAAIPNAKAWDLTPTMTLRENVEAWAKTAGWTVSWAAVDYPVSSKVSLTGVFEDEATGPLVQLAKAYEKAEQPLNFTFYTNKVVRVENSTYKQINVNDQLPNHRAMQ